MGIDLRFNYKREVWYVSTFINTDKVIGENKAEEIEALLINKIRNLTEKDLKRTFEKINKLPNAEANKKYLMDMAKNFSIECDWVPYIENFPYTDENNPYTEKNEDLIFNTLGYFRFEVEHYKNNPQKKELVSPLLIQQFPFVLLPILKEFCEKKENEHVNIDVESPAYVFVISNGTKPAEVQWTPENIINYKETIGYWTEIYSGQWPDYSEDVFDRRIKDNLSNRLSEMHFIGRNSGFIYMAPENYESFMNYMETAVMEPTAKMRSMIFALTSINQSLDILFAKRYSDVFMSLKTIEDKIKNLRFLRGMIQTKLSQIYNELDWNRRPHYTSVLKHLISEFDLNDIFNRVNTKFDFIYDAMQELYLKKNEENQARTERGLNLLNVFFSAGILADLVSVIMIALSLQEGDPSTIILNAIVAVIISGILVATIMYLIYNRIKLKTEEGGKTIDAVIEDDKGNVILIKRKYPPYKGKYALPGGFIKSEESPEQALIREVREETNLNVEITHTIGTYDEKGRDPRGKVISKAFKCIIVDDLSKIEAGGDASSAERVPIEKIKALDLAFDHKKILKDSGILK